MQRNKDDQNFARYMRDLLATSEPNRPKACLQLKAIVISDREQIKKFFSECSLMQIYAFLTVSESDSMLAQEVISLLSDKRVLAIYHDSDSKSSSSWLIKIHEVFAIEHLIRNYKNAYHKYSNLSPADEQVLRQFLQALHDTKTSTKAGWVGEKCASLYKKHDSLIDKLIATFDQSALGIQLLKKIFAIYKLPLSETKHLADLAPQILCNHGNQSILAKVDDWLKSISATRIEELFKRSARYKALKQRVDATKARQIAEHTSRQNETTKLMQNIETLAEENANANICLQMKEADFRVQKEEIVRLHQMRSIISNDYQSKLGFLNNNTNLLNIAVTQLRCVLQSKQQELMCMDLDLQTKQIELEHLVIEIVELRHKITSNDSKIKTCRETLESLSPSDSFSLDIHPGSQPMQETTNNVDNLRNINCFSSVYSAAEPVSDFDNAEFDQLNNNCFAVTDTTDADSTLMNDEMINKAFDIINNNCFVVTDTANADSASQTSHSTYMCTASGLHAMLAANSPSESVASSHQTTRSDELVPLSPATTIPTFDDFEVDLTEIDELTLKALLASHDTFFHTSDDLDAADFTSASQVSVDSFEDADSSEFSGEQKHKRVKYKH